MSEAKPVYFVASHKVLDRATINDVYVPRAVDCLNKFDVEILMVNEETEVIEGQTGLYELGGPKVAAFRDLMETMLAETRRRRLLLPLPFFAARIMAFGLDIAGAVTSIFGLPNAILTRDQVRLLEHDNVVSGGAKTLADLGIEATSVESVVGDYLYAYRPYGQYDAITESAANLKA